MAREEVMEETSTVRPARAATPTETLAAFVLETDASAVPPAVRRATSLLLLDGVGIAFSNRDQAFARGLREVLETSARAGPSTVLGSRSRLVAEAAAEANSSAIHGSDLDATHIASIIHPTAVVVPVALAVGEEADSSGREVMTAVACGMEALIRLGLAAAGRFHVRGYQPTALLGSVVAALVTARLRRHPTTAAVSAAGLATAVSAGLRSFSDDGTWGKRIITGWACRTGIHAESLVAAGFRGSRDALEKKWGLFPAFLPEGGFDLDLALDGLGTTWAMTATAPKRYPCSHGLHPFIDSALAVRGRFELGLVERVECRVNAEATRWWFEPAALRYRPDAYGARFSIPYVVARALHDGEVLDGAFEPDAVGDPAVLALCARVVPVLDDTLAERAPVGLPGALTVRLRDGSSIDVASAPDHADDAEFVRRRFRSTIAGVLGDTAADRLEAAVLDAWSAGSIRDVLALAAV